MSAEKGGPGDAGPLVGPEDAVPPEGQEDGGTPRRRNRRDVIQAAGRLFAQRGFHGTSMRDLGDTLGLHGSSLYAHVGSKTELLEEIVADGVRQCIDLADEVLAGDEPAADKLRWLVTGHVRLVVANLDTWTTFVNEYRFLPEPERERVIGLRDRYQGAYRSVIKEGAAEGWVREDLDDRLAATLVLSLLNAVSGWYRPNGDRSPEQLADAVYELVIGGIT
jgi:AcrR family transcriptional regulator